MEHLLYQIKNKLADRLKTNLNNKHVYTQAVAVLENKENKEEKDKWKIIQKKQLIKHFEAKAAEDMEILSWFPKDPVPTGTVKELESADQEYAELEKGLENC